MDSASGGGSVLVPTGREMQSYGCLRSLNQRGIHTVAASELDGLPQFASRYCSERARIAASPTDLPGYRDELLRLADRDDVETIIPGREYDAYVLSRFADAFEDHVSLLVPEAETLATAHDRLRLAREAREAGVPMARTRRLSAVEEWDADVVVKSRYNLLTADYVDSFPTERIAEVRDVRFLPAGTEPDRASIRASMNHDPIVQDFIPQADKHLYCALWEDGEPVATYQHRQIRRNSWVGGGGVYRVSAYAPAVEEAAYDLLSQLEWNGLACIEYVKDADTGEWKFLEINPRTWQSLPEAVRAGVDFPYGYWQRARGETAPVDDDYETGQGCHIAYGELAHLRSVRHDRSPFADPPSFGRTLWEIATSCVTNPRFDYLRRDDPMLVLSALRSTVSSGVTASREYEDGSGGLRASPTGDASDS